MVTGLRGEKGKGSGPGAIFCWSSEKKNSDSKPAEAEIVVQEGGKEIKNSHQRSNSKKK